MKYFLSAAMAAGWFCLAMAAFAQSTSAPQSTASPKASPNTSPAAASANSAPGSSTDGGKRAACLTTVQNVKGQDRQDQMQLCMAQARVDCLKQAIDQKVVGPQRRDFVKNCVREE